MNGIGAVCVATGNDWRAIEAGAHAHAAVRALAERGAIRARLAFGRHLSQRAVNMIPGANDTAGRIGVWCDGVIDQLQHRA